MPSAPEGGPVKREWLEQWRLPAAPSGAVKTVVGIDPADSGSGDACGIVAASLTAEGVVAVIADVSARMTSDQWARAAVALAIDVGASQIAVEGFAARETYRRVVNDALRRAKLNRPITVTTWPPGGGGDAMARSAALLQGLETGTTRIAGYLPGLEQSAVTWQAGQHQPDSLAAVVVAHDAGQFELPHCWPESRQEIGGATADAAYLRTSGLSFLLPGRYLGALFGPFANHHNTRNYGVNVLAQIFQMIADSVTVRGSHCRS